MTENLYFIPILARALDSDASVEGLRDSFRKIEALGRAPEYRVGFRQFEEFVAEALSLALPDVHLERERRELACIPSQTAAAGFLVRGIIPGIYAVRLSTGRVVWKGALDANDLALGATSSLESLPMAADSERPEETWSRELTVLDGEIVVRVYPGIGSGALRIWIRR